MSAGRWRENFFQARLRRPTRSSSSRMTRGVRVWVTTAKAGLLIVLDAWIEPAVRQIREQVEQHDENRDEHQITHEQAEILLAQRGDEQPSGARPREDLLGDQRAAHQERYGERDDGHHRHKPVLETVL